MMFCHWKNSLLGDYLHRIYPNDPEVKDTTETQKSASDLDLYIEIDNGGRSKAKLYDKRGDFTFPEFTFHNSYVILEFVPSTVIFWIELSCFRKSCSHKATFLLGWSHRYKNSTVVITTWLIVTKYPYLKWQWIFYFLRRCFVSSITARTFIELYYIYE